MAKDILYTPNLDYEKNYYTEGSNLNNNSNTDDSNQSGSITITKDDEIKRLQSDIEDNIAFLPGVIRDTYLSPYYGMKEEYDRIISSLPKKDPTDDDSEDKKPSIILPDEIIVEEDNNDLPPDPWDVGPTLVVPKPEKDTSKIDKQKLKYYIDYIDIYEDYLVELNKAITGYMIKTSQVLTKLELNKNVASYETKDLKNKKISHLSDYIIKSDIVLEQSIRLHKKLFPNSETVLHLRSLRVSNEQILRYMDIDKIEEKDNIDITSNILLTESLKVAQKKYEENFYSLYKYLNSSVILLTESTKAMVKQTKCMVAINRYEEKE